MERCPAEGHDRKEGSVHHGESHIPEFFICIAENDLAQLVFDAEFLKAGFLQDLVGAGIGSVQDKPGLPGFSVFRFNGENVPVPGDFTDLHAAQDRNLFAVSGDFFKQVILQDHGVVGILAGPEGTVAHAFVEIGRRVQFLAGNPRGPAEVPELVSVRPGISGGCGIDLVEGTVDAEFIIPVEPFEIAGGFQGSGQ